MKISSQKRKLWIYFLIIGVVVFGVLLTQLVINATGENQKEIPTLQEAPTDTPVHQPSASESIVIHTKPSSTSTQPMVNLHADSTVTAEPTHENSATVTLNVDQWKTWPVLPSGVSEEMKELYQAGLEMGNNPQAFSIMGDCHSLPDVFLGRYDKNPEAVKQLKPALQETVLHFQGSFNRYSPTVTLGATAGAILWFGWNQNEEGYCLDGEIPIDCELRVHKPIIAFVHVGTHYETRHDAYLTTIIEKLIANGTVPIIVIKADNLELDERVNETLARLAVEYKLPVWNFWAAVQDLPNLGLNDENPMYLSDVAYDIHRSQGLQVLDIIHRSLQDY
jgi:hypothetical protein